MDKEIIRLLNETTYDDSEIQEFIEFANIDDEKLEKITSDVKTKIAKELFKKSGVFVQSLLKENEKIEKIIKGTDIDLLEEATMINTFMLIPFMSGDGYSFSRIIFCTNKRIIILASNYYNKPLDAEIYDIKDIRKITVGKSIKRQYRLKKLFKGDKSIAKVILAPLLSLPMLFGITVTSYVFVQFINTFITQSEIISKLSFWSVTLGFSYILIARPKLTTEVLLEIYDGNSYDIIIRNEDYKDIHKYLQDLK